MALDTLFELWRVGWLPAHANWYDPYNRPPPPPQDDSFTDTGAGRAVNNAFSLVRKIRESLSSSVEDAGIV